MPMLRISIEMTSSMIPKPASSLRSACIGSLERDELDVELRPVDRVHERQRMAAAERDRLVAARKRAAGDADPRSRLRRRDEDERRVRARELAVHPDVL